MALLTQVKAKKVGQISMMDEEGFPPPPPEIPKEMDCLLGRCVYVENDYELHEIFLGIEPGAEVAIDTETTSLHFMDSRVVLVSFSFDGKTAYVFKPERVSAKLFLQLLRDKPTRNIFHNAKFDVKHLKYHYGIDISVDFDTMIGKQIGWAGISEGAGLAQCAIEFLGTMLPKDPRKDFADPYLAIRPEHVSYAATDALATYLIYAPIKQRLIDVKQWDAWERIEKPLLPVLVDVEMRGIPLDMEKLQELRAVFTREHAEAAKALHAALGGRIENVNSTKQLMAAFEAMDAGLASTGKEVIKEKAAAKETSKAVKKACEALLNYRELNKVLTTYIIPYIEEHGKTGKIYPEFNQAGALTGRLSCRSPNVQQMPARVHNFREIFVAPPGYLVCWSDYGQYELRVLAQLSRDPTLIDIFQQGLDLHRATAARLFKKPIEDITDKERTRAKNLQFAILYGMGPHRLAINLDCDIKEAYKILDAYKKQFPRVNQYKEMTEHLAETKRVVEDLTGRKIFFPKPSGDWEGAERILEENKRRAVNSRVQGSNATVVKDAQIILHNRIKESGIDGWIMLTVHDEIVTAVREDQIDDMKRILEGAMIEASKKVLTVVPSVVDVKSGPRWTK